MKEDKQEVAKNYGCDVEPESEEKGQDQINCWSFVEVGEVNDQKQEPADGEQEH